MASRRGNAKLEHPVPDGAIHNTGVRTLLAVMAQSRPTVRSVAAETGYSVNVTHHHLDVLRNLGLVDWEVGRQGTLHATCEMTLDPEMLEADLLTREQLIEMWEKGEPVELATGPDDQRAEQ